LYVNPDTLSFRTTKGFELINPAEILYFSIENNEVKLFLMDGNTSITLHTLKELEVMLEPFHFYRCHARYLINLAHVKRYTHKNRIIELSNSQQVKVAFDRKTKFKQLICSTLPPPVNLIARTMTQCPDIGFNLKNIGFRCYFVGFSA
jgi:DNA-binding LytR/AlgR family response regulator